MKIRYGITAALIIGVLAFNTQAFAQSALTPLQKRLVSGFVSHELDQQRAGLAASRSLTAAAPGTKFLSAGAYDSGENDACSKTIGSNVKVNQNCLNLSNPNLQGRGQAQNETAIAQDPMNSKHLVASYNDYRRGDGTCGISYSLDGGEHWSDATTPNGFTRGAPFGGVARQYWHAGGDTAVAWDTKGNAYLQCQTFMRGPGTTNNPDQSSAVYVFRSTQNNGASWNFTGRPVVEASTSTGAPFEDKPYMTVDGHLGSPFQDRVYVTWTEFGADGSAYIWGSYSNDYGEHFSPQVLVSSNSSLCTVTFGVGTPQGNCNQNQYSQPFTGPDGALYVVFANFNNTVTGSDNRNQILLVKSIDGGATFSAPVKVADYYDLPDCLTYQGQDAGRACVPEKGTATNSVFRATNYPSGAVSPNNPNLVAVTTGSYINKNSNESTGTGCTPAGFSGSTGNNLFTGTKLNCSNQILLSVSANGGATFTGGTIDPRSLPVVSVQRKVADAFWQWAAFTRWGALTVAYYDRSYGNDDTTGSLDFSASSSSDRIHFTSTRATSSSMPLPTQFPNGQGNSVFFGDYAGLSALDGIHPFWMDTRNQDRVLCPGTGTPGVPPQVCGLVEPNGLRANDQEVFTTTIE